MNKDLFYCDTAYQVFTSLNIILSNHLTEKPDIVVYHQFNGSAELCIRLKQEELFDNIYEVYPSSSEIKDILRLVCCKSFLAKEVGFKHNKYETFYCATLDTNASLAIYSSAKYNKCVLYDDGTGSYRGNIIWDNMTKKRFLFMKFFHLWVKYFEFQKYLLYSPQMSLTKACEEKEKIDFHYSEIMERVFDYKSNDLYENKIVFLDQPYTNEKIRSPYDKKLGLILEKITGKGIIIRLHPRMKKGSISCGDIDVNNNLWELECKNQISNNNILISIYSTAMFQPSLVMGLNPTLIFLFELYDDLYSKEQKEQINKHIKRYQEIFRSTKIYIPTNWDMLENVLQSEI